MDIERTTCVTLLSRRLKPAAAIDPVRLAPTRGRLDVTWTSSSGLLPDGGLSSHEHTGFTIFMYARSSVAAYVEIRTYKGIRPQAGRPIRRTNSFSLWVRMTSSPPSLPP